MNKELKLRMLWSALQHLKALVKANPYYKDVYKQEAQEYLSSLSKKKRREFTATYCIDAAWIEENF